MLRRLIGPLLIALPLVLAAASPILAAEAYVDPTWCYSGPTGESIIPHAASDDTGWVSPGTVVHKGAGAFVCEDGEMHVAHLDAILKPIALMAGKLIVVEASVFAVTALVISGIKRDRSRKVWLIPSALVVGAFTITSVVFAMLNVGQDVGADLIAIGVGVLAAIWYERTKPRLAGDPVTTSTA